jgi:hypothetical protein
VDNPVILAEVFSSCYGLASYSGSCGQDSAVTWLRVCSQRGTNTKNNKDQI